MSDKTPSIKARGLDGELQRAVCLTETEAAWLHVRTRPRGGAGFGVGIEQLPPDGESARAKLRAVLDAWDAERDA